MAFTQTTNAETDTVHTDNQRLYNPYADLEIPPSKLYQLPTRPEFLFHEESTRQRRSWAENLTYYTGSGYLTGVTLGAGYGLIQGLRAIEGGDTVKLMLNRVLNSTATSGTRWGNRVGVFGLVYAGVENGLVSVRDKDDALNSVVAGVASGVLCNAASGPRAAVVAGAAGGLLAGVLVAAKHAAKRYVAS